MVNKKRRPATTPEARENQLIAMVYDLAEKQITEGTATSQVITHFLKLATKKERYENEILEQQKELMKAKTEAIKSQKKTEELYRDALKAMSSYRGQTEQGDDYED